MNFYAALKKEHSKKNTVAIAKELLLHTEKFKGFIDLFSLDEKLISQRAIWVVREVLQANPSLLDNETIDVLIVLLKQDIHPAIARNVLAIISECEFNPKENQTEAFINLSFDYLNDKSRPIAIRVHAMSVIQKFIALYPELAVELIYILKEELPYGTAGFKSRALKTIKELEHLSKS